MEQLQGTLENVIYQSGDGGFCVLRVKTAAGLATVTYKGMAPYMGENIAMEGEWCEHVRFGRQFRADALRVVKPPPRTALSAFWHPARLRALAEPWRRVLWSILAAAR